jgi:hypothetical protein
MPTPKKPKRVTKSDVENGKEMIVAKARGELKSAVYDAYRGPNAKLGIAGQPEGPMARKLDKARQSLLDVNKSVAEYGRWANKARTDIPGYNPTAPVIKRQKGSK